MVVFALCVGFADQHGGDLFMIRRREFIAGLGGAAAWPLAARAQQSDRMRRVDVLVGLAEEDPETQGRLATFRRGMQQRDCRNLQIDYRWAGPEAERVMFYAAELVRTQPDLILAITRPSVAALQRATHTIPIVFVGIADPVDLDRILKGQNPSELPVPATGSKFGLTIPTNLLAIADEVIE
jgi:hypothetical protein